MSTAIQNRVPAGRPAGGQFAGSERREPEVELDRLSRFPHPDPKYPHPMKAWPDGVDVPESVELGTTDVDTTPAHVRDPQLETAGGFSRALIRMPNGATLSFQELSGDEADVRWEGDWDAYAAEGSDERDGIADVALEYTAQAR